MQANFKYQCPGCREKFTKLKQCKKHLAESNHARFPNGLQMQKACTIKEVKVVLKNSGHVSSPNNPNPATRVSPKYGCPDCSFEGKLSALKSHIVTNGHFKGGNMSGLQKQCLIGMTN